MLVRIAYRFIALQMKIFSPYGEQVRYAYNGAAFEAKKEIPVKAMGLSEAT
jgi:hypothetical protein